MSKSLFALAFFILASACTNVKPETNARIPAATEGDNKAIREGFVPVGGLDPNKRTVCTVTLNSDNEALQFRKHLPLSDFQFVELFDQQDKWLERACAANVKCDIVVFSGHFLGGQFRGTRGILELSNLEQNTCGHGCAGIFHDPKEVFLFGCNTLAGKEADVRSIEETRRVYIEETGDRVFADMAVALRRSAMGQTFKDRMSRAFSGVPRIYGFRSVGPTGDHVEPLLEGYFARIGNYANYLNRNFGPKASVQLSEAANKIFIRALSVTVATQTAGVPRSAGQVIPMCYLQDPSVAELDKVRWVDKSLRSKNPYTFLPEIRTFVRSNRTVTDRASEAKIFSDLGTDPVIKDKMRQLITKDLPGYPGFLFDAMDASLFFGWQSAAEIQKLKEDFFHAHLKNSMTSEDVDLLCSSPSLGAYVTDEMIRDVQNDSMYNALVCLAPSDVRIHRRLLALVKSMYANPSPAYAFGNPAFDALQSMRISDPQLLGQILNELLNARTDGYRRVLAGTLTHAAGGDSFVIKLINQALDTPNTASVRVLWESLKSVRFSSGVQQYLAGLLEVPAYAGLRKDILLVMRNSATSDPAIQRNYLRLALETRDGEVQEAAIRALGRSSGVDPQMLYPLMPMLLSGSNTNTRWSILAALRELGVRDEQILLAETQAIQFDSAFTVRTTAWGHFKNIGLSNPRVLSELVRIAETTQDADWRQTVLENLRELAPADDGIRARMALMGAVY